MATKRSQRNKEDGIIELFDELFGIKENAEFRKFMRYRFFGTSLPDDDTIEIFMDFDSNPNESLFIDEDKIYYPYLAIERKLLFEHKKYKNKIKSKGIEHKICWKSAEELKKSMDPIINGLLQSKKDYVAAQTREQERSRGRRAKERARNGGSEGDEDSDIDDDDDNATQEIDEEERVRLNQRTNLIPSPLPMVCSEFIYYLKCEIVCFQFCS